MTEVTVYAKPEISSLILTYGTLIFLILVFALVIRFLLSFIKSKQSRN